MPNLEIDIFFISAANEGMMMTNNVFVTEVESFILGKGCGSLYSLYKGYLKSRAFTVRLFTV